MHPHTPLSAFSPGYLIKARFPANSNRLPGLQVPFPVTQALHHGCWGPPIWPKLSFQQAHVCLLPSLYLRLQPLRMPTSLSTQESHAGLYTSGMCPAWKPDISHFFTYQALSSNHLKTNLVFKTIVNSIWHVFCIPIALFTAFPSHH